LIILGISLKISDDADDIFKSKRLSCKTYGFNLAILLILLLFDNVYIYFGTLIVFCSGILLVPNGFFGLDRLIVLVSIYCLCIIYLNLKKIDIRSVLFIIFISLTTFIWFINEHSNPLLRYNIINPIFIDKEVSKKKIIYRLLGSIILIIQFLYLNKLIYEYFRLDDKDCLIIANAIVIGTASYLMVSVINQIYAILYINKYYWNKSSRIH